MRSVQLLVLSMALAACENDTSPDGGPQDTGAVDASADAPSRDAGLADSNVDVRNDAAPWDGGVDAGDDAGPMVTGITCIVRDGCGAGPETFEDVPFFFAEDSLYSPVRGLFSPLAGLRRLYVAENYVMPAEDSAGLGYIVGGDGRVQIQRRGMLIDVDIHAARGGTCMSGALIDVRCSGTDVLTQNTDYCPLWDATGDEGEISCSVVERDADCEESTRMVTPRFWLADGPHGPNTELHTDEAALAEALGFDGDVILHKEGICSSYRVDVRDNMNSQVLVEGGRVWGAIGGIGGETCRDRLGNRRPSLLVRCPQGLSPLSPAP